jgi:seryl-tRNA synthetase
VLDIKWIRDHSDAFVKGLTDRGFDDPTATLNRILSLDEQRRTTIQQLQEAQARRNAASKEIGQAKQAKDEAKAEALKEEVARLKTVIQEGEAGEREADKKLHDLLASIPNMPASDVPVGPDAGANVVLREVGKPKKFPFQPRQHFELGEALGLMDFETAAKLSGARFVVLKGALARLERALAQFMLDLHVKDFDYLEVSPPALVKESAAYGTGQLPKLRDDLFRTEIFSPHQVAEFIKSYAVRAYEDRMRSSLQRHKAKLFAALVAGGVEAYRSEFDKVWEDEAALAREDITQRAGERAQTLLEENQRWLIPTAEVPLTNLVREDILDESKLPLRYTACTPCFRAEAGAAGKDTRGMIRQHQFSKVELVSITTPEQSADEHERMTECAETVLKRLEIPYRTVVLSTGDMGFASQKTYDIEVWLPGQGTYREISSCSNCGDFQARRMNARCKAKGAKETRFVHTLNGSGVAVGRALIAVLENYQEVDGSVRIPEVLKPYMGGLTKIAPPK